MTLEEQFEADQAKARKIGLEMTMMLMTETNTVQGVTMALVTIAWLDQYPVPLQKELAMQFIKIILKSIADAEATPPERQH